jgi:5-methylcytosine-specific restriction endonuclease McrA
LIRFYLSVNQQKREMIVTTNTTEVFRQTVAVFSRNYLPINQVNIRRAIILLVTGKAEPLDLGNAVGKPISVHSPTMAILVPQQIRLTISYRERMWRVPAVNRREVLRRDKHSCQYCGNTKHLTIDHVIPVSKGGKNTWDNVITACESCNNRKGDRTPQQAGMALRSEPKAPVHPFMAFAEQFWREQKVLHEEFEN